jgi:exodeoxyribonuclease VII small subunit
VLRYPHRAIATGLRHTFRTSTPPMVTSSETPASFEAALTELEQIVSTMEGGQLPLQDSLAAYKRGAALLQYCQTVLKDAQQQVEVLEKGVLKSFAPAAAESVPDNDGS